MEDGSGQSLLFLAVMVAWAVLSFLESQARKRQQRQRMEEMEQEEEAEASGGGTAVEVEPGRWEQDAPWEPPARWEPPAPAPLPSPAPSPRAAEPAADSAPEAPELSPTQLSLEAERLREESRRDVRRTDVAPPDATEDRSRGGRAARRAADVDRARPTGPAAPAAPALRQALRGDPHALRDAVLYREILGRPLGSRPGPGGWEEPGA